MKEPTIKEQLMIMWHGWHRSQAARASAEALGEAYNKEHLTWRDGEHVAFKRKRG